MTTTRAENPDFVNDEAELHESYSLDPAEGEQLELPFDDTTDEAADPYVEALVRIEDSLKSLGEELKSLLTQVKELTETALEIDQRLQQLEDYR